MAVTFDTTLYLATLVARSYQIQKKITSSFMLTRVSTSCPILDSERFLAIDAEWIKMIEQDIEQVSSPDMDSYGLMFVVPKVSDGWKPVIDLSPLSEFFKTTKFRRNTTALVLLSVRPP